MGRRGRGRSRCRAAPSGGPECSRRIVQRFSPLRIPVYQMRRRAVTARRWRPNWRPSHAGVRGLPLSQGCAATLERYCSDWRNRSPLHCKRSEAISMRCALGAGLLGRVKPGHRFAPRNDSSTKQMCSSQVDRALSRPQRLVGIVNVVRPSPCRSGARAASRRPTASFLLGEVPAIGVDGTASRRGIGSSPGWMMSGPSGVQSRTPSEHAPAASIRRLASAGSRRQKMLFSRPV